MTCLADLEAPAPSYETLYRLAFELDNRSIHQAAPEKAGEAVSKLLSVAQSHEILSASLAAEILTNQGIPTLPIEAIVASQKDAGASLLPIDGAKHVAATLRRESTWTTTTSLSWCTQPTFAKPSPWPAWWRGSSRLRLRVPLTSVQARERTCWLSRN